MGIVISYHIFSICKGIFCFFFFWMEKHPLTNTMDGFEKSKKNVWAPSSAPNAHLYERIWWNSMKDQEQQLLDEIYKGCQMGLDALKEMIPKVDSKDLAADLNEHQKDL